MNLPPQFFGINKTGILGQDPTPWDDEFEVELLRPPALGVASYVSFIEAAIFHKPSKALLVTDAVVYVSENIPDCIPDRDLEESGDDDNFTISALKFLNLFDIKTKAKNRTTSSKDMNREELLRLGGNETRCRRCTLDRTICSPPNRVGLRSRTDSSSRPSSARWCTKTSPNR